jgi:glycosyltransferase involved in cell wall biosynthesis
MIDNTLFSIVTVVFNDVDHIEQTIKSILNQSYRNIEYIIVDGGSTDGTVDVINKYQKNITTFISEKDEGIYFAMNKGIKLAKGEYIIFINSGDVFYKKNVISDIAKTPLYPDIIYGAYEVVYPNHQKIIKNHTLNVNFVMNISHQAIFAKRQLLLENLFDTHFKIAADAKFIYSCYSNGKSFLKTPLIISTVSSGGLSDNNKLAIKEYYEIKKSINSNLKLLLIYWYKLAELSLKNVIKMALPSKITIRIQLMKNKLFE